jgi:hypothetical protein
MTPHKICRCGIGITCADFVQKLDLVGFKPSELTIFYCPICALREIERTRGVAHAWFEQAEQEIAALLELPCNECSPAQVPSYEVATLLRLAGWCTYVLADPVPDPFTLRCLLSDTTELCSYARDAARGRVWVHATGAPGGTPLPQPTLPQPTRPPRRRAPLLGELACGCNTCSRLR